MKFKPRDEYEREAFSIERPKFDVDERVQAVRNGVTINGVVTDVYIRTVNHPLWMYQVDGDSEWYDVWMLTGGLPSCR